MVSVRGWGGHAVERCLLSRESACGPHGLRDLRMEILWPSDEAGACRGVDGMAERVWVSNTFLEGNRYSSLESSRLRG